MQDTEGGIFLKEGAGCGSKGYYENPSWLCGCVRGDLQAASGLYEEMAFGAGTSCVSAVRLGA